MDPSLIYDFPPSLPAPQCNFKKKETGEEAHGKRLPTKKATQKCLKIERFKKKSKILKWQICSRIYDEVPD